MALHLAAFAAVPLRWTVETSRVQPVAFDAVHGESIALEATFKSYGTDVQLPATAALYYQTNGMGSAWWTIPASVSSNRITAVFAPTNDPGAASVSGFIGTTGEIFRAAFTLRFRKGPGATPNAIAAPVPILDLANTTVVNPPWPTTNDFQTATNLMQSALKEYVDAEIEGAGVITPTTVTNIVDAKIADIPKEGVSTNAVSGIITNHVTSGYLCTVAAAQDMTNDATLVRYKNAKLMHGAEDISAYDLGVLPAPYEGLMFYLGGKDNNASFILGEWSSIYFVHPWEDGREGSAHLSYDSASDSIYVYHTGLGINGRIAAIGDISSASVTNAGAVAAAKSYTDSNAYPKTSGDTLATQVSTIGGHLNAEDARFVSTNYNSATRMPEAYVEVKQSNEWLRVWSEMTRWNAFTGSAFDWTTWGGFHAWSTNIAAQLDEKSPRQYAFYDGVTGEVAPDDYFWISQPHVAVCAGAGYQRYMDGAHEVWVLESNGMVADINGTTNGYFRITDSEGDTQFEIIKGDKQTVFANAYAMTMTNVNGVTHYYTTYAVTNAVAAPTARVSVTGPASGFTAEGSSCPANVSWTAGQNCYILEWWPKSSYSQMFVKADYERGGDTIIKNNAPVQMQTIYIGGKKYSLSTTTISGETVLKLTEVQ